MFPPLDVVIGKTLLLFRGDALLYNPILRLRINALMKDSYIRAGEKYFLSSLRRDCKGTIKLSSNFNMEVMKMRKQLITIFH